VADLSSVRGSGTEVGPSGAGGFSWRAWVEASSVFGYADTERDAQRFADRALGLLREGIPAEAIMRELRSEESTQDVMSRLDGGTWSGEAEDFVVVSDAAREKLAESLYAAWSLWRIETEHVRSTLWWCTRDDLKAEFYAAADRIFAWKPTDDDLPENA